MIFISSLDKLKKIVEDHLRRELDIFEEVLKLDEDDTRTFLNWYTSHPYVKGIEEVVEAVRGRTDKKIEGIWVKRWEERRE